MSIVGQASMMRTIRARGRRMGWAVALLGLGALPAAGLMAASTASALTPPTITAVYDANAVNPETGKVTPSVVINGTGFMIERTQDDGGDKIESVLDLSIPNPRWPGQFRNWWGYDNDGTLAGQICTVVGFRIPCRSYQAGDLREIRIFLVNDEEGPSPRCGDHLQVHVSETNQLPNVGSNTVDLRVLCATGTIYHPRSL
jgi:hypothetical protein